MRRTVFEFAKSKGFKPNKSYTKKNGCVRYGKFYCNMVGKYNCCWRINFGSLKEKDADKPYRYVINDSSCFEHTHEMDQEIISGSRTYKKFITELTEKEISMIQSMLRSPPSEICEQLEFWFKKEYHPDLISRTKQKYLKLTYGNARDGWEKLRQEKSP